MGDLKKIIIAIIFIYFIFSVNNVNACVVDEYYDYSKK
jgi:hypothetical protein